MRSLRLLFLIPLIGCSLPAPEPPVAEFLVADGSATYWVQSGPRGITARISPLILTTANDRFYQVYVGESARSYSDAVFITEPLFRRDLVTGDSTLLLEDSVVGKWEKHYLALSPGARLLDPDDAEEAEVDFAASSESDILGVIGPYVLYHQRATVERADYSKTDSSRGAIDIRSGKVVALSAVVRDSSLLGAGGTREKNGVRWRHAGYEVVARFDTARAETRVVLLNSRGREWSLGYVDSRLPRIFWLDQHRADSRLRIALSEAFDDALLDDGNTQFVSGRRSADMVYAAVGR